MWGYWPIWRPQSDTPRLRNWDLSPPPPHSLLWRLCWVPVSDLRTKIKRYGLITVWHTHRHTITVGITHSVITWIFIRMDSSTLAVVDPGFPKDVNPSRGYQPIIWPIFQRNWLARSPWNPPMIRIILYNLNTEIPRGWSIEPVISQPLQFIEQGSSAAEH